MCVFSVSTTTKFNVSGIVLIMYACLYAYGRSLKPVLKLNVLLFSAGVPLARIVLMLIPYISFQGASNCYYRRAW